MMKMTVSLAVCLSMLLWTTVSSSDRLHRRSDDTDPLLAVISRLTQDVSALQAELQAVKNTLGKKAVFVSNLNTETPTVNAPIHMQVLSEVGGGYDVTSGMYVAPFSGWYSVDFQLFPRDPPQVAFNVDLHLNGDTVDRARCHDVNLAVTCNSGVTLHVRAGDKLWIQSDYGGRFYLAGFDNVFSAVLITPDE